MKAHDARMRPTAGPHLLTFPLSPSFNRRHRVIPDLTA